MAIVHENRDSERLDEHVAPPFLRRVRIRGYKSIAFCDVTLEPLTILVGRNATGKSNFVDALTFLRDVVFLGVTEASRLRGGAEAIKCGVSSDSGMAIQIQCVSASLPNGVSERPAA